MQLHSPLSARRIPTKGLLTLAAFASLTGLAVAAGGVWSAPAVPEMSAASAALAEANPPVEQGGPGAGLPVVRVTIRPTGFDPAEVTLPRGRFLLAVDNRSGLGELTFRLDREGGGRLHEVRMPRGRLAWRKVVEPAAGTYLITEAARPEWVSRVRVTD